MICRSQVISLQAGMVCSNCEACGFMGLDSKNSRCFAQVLHHHRAVPHKINTQPCVQLQRSCRKRQQQNLPEVDDVVVGCWADGKLRGPQAAVAIAARAAAAIAAGPLLAVRKDHLLLGGPHAQLVAAEAGRLGCQRSVPLSQRQPGCGGGWVRQRQRVCERAGCRETQAARLSGFQGGSSAW